MSFVLGDTVVFPGKGVGIIIGEGVSEIRGKKLEVYFLQLEQSRIEVPVRSMRIRFVMNNDDLEEIYTVLSDRETKPNQTTWNRRYREYMSHINSGETPRIASVLRDLERLDIRKNLSFGESKMHLKAKSLVLEEGAYTLMSRLIRDSWEGLLSGTITEAPSSEDEDAPVREMDPTTRKLQQLFYYINEPHDEWTNNITGEIYLVPESVEVLEGDLELHKANSLLVKNVSSEMMQPYLYERLVTYSRKPKSTSGQDDSKDGTTRLELYKEQIQARIDELFADERALAEAEAAAALAAKKAKKAKKSKGTQ